MKILAIECSAAAASCAVIENGKVTSQSFINVKLTHSETLLPMVTAMLNSAKLSIADINALAVSNGPGSFTGIRIGIALVKGLAAPKNLPCVGVSTLEAMAQNFILDDCVVCGVMDARCNQVYNALFRIKNGKIKRITPDRALLCSELASELKKRHYACKVIVTGDGKDVFAPYINDIKNAQIANEGLAYQTAVGVGLLAEAQLLKGNSQTAESLLPVYLRLPQAERELNKKRSN